MLNSKEKLINIFKLLDDSSSEIQNIVYQQILQNSLELILNKQTYRASLSYNLRIDLDNLLKNMHLDIACEAFKKLINMGSEDIDLEKSNLVISYWSDSEISCENIKQKLDEISQAVQSTIPNSGHPLAFTDHINDYLFEELRIRGNTEDYYNPENSFLHKLLETKKGIPITISVLYMLIGSRLGLPVYGVPMPGHFILKFHNHEDEVFFDPFYEGKVYSRDMCLNYLRNVNAENSEEILNGCSNYDIVIRVLKNLHLVYSSYQYDPEKVQQVELFLEIFERNYVNQV